MTKKWNITEMKACNRRKGGEWFTPGAMKFFNTKIQRGVYQGKGGIFFVTSERFDRDSPLRFTVRQFDPKKCKVSTRGPFNKMWDREGAKSIAQHLAKGYKYTGFGAQRNRRG